MAIRTSKYTRTIAVATAMFLLIIWSVFAASLAWDSNCDTKHCWNGGSCVRTFFVPTCLCPVNFFGRHCELTFQNIPEQPQPPPPVLTTPPPQQHGDFWSKAIIIGVSVVLGCIAIALFCLWCCKRGHKDEPLDDLHTTGEAAAGDHSRPGEINCAYGSDMTDPPPAYSALELPPAYSSLVKGGGKGWRGGEERGEASASGGAVAMDDGSLDPLPEESEDEHHATGNSETDSMHPEN